MVRSSRRELDEILERAMKELPVNLIIDIQALLQLEVKKLWDRRSDSYWRDRIKSYVEAIRVFKNNNIYLKEK
jgi:hypothetical protein